MNNLPGRSRSDGFHGSWDTALFSLLGTTPLKCETCFYPAPWICWWMMVWMSRSPYCLQITSKTSLNTWAVFAGLQKHAWVIAVVCIDLKMLADVHAGAERKKHCFQCHSVVLFSMKTSLLARFSPSSDSTQVFVDRVINKVERLCQSQNQCLLIIFSCWVAPNRYVAYMLPLCWMLMEVQHYFPC